MNIFPISFIQRQIPVQLPTTGSISTPYNQLNTIATYLRNYVSDFRNPQFFVYRLDGTAFQITDGGNDMFDGGNSTVPYLRSNVTYWNPGSSALATAPAVSYAVTSSTLTDTNFGYVSLGYTQSAGTFPASQSSIYHPLTMLGARSGSGPIGWQKTGNIGADGRGSILTGSLYNGSVINGFTTYAYFRQTYGDVTDPNICDVYMLLGHPNWNSNYGSIIWSASMSTAGQGGILYATGSASNLLAVTALLSRTGSTPAGASLPISASDLQTVVTNYTLRIKEAIGY
jgi:hypothetical protein